jgi:hypothetical protein
MSNLTRYPSGLVNFPYCVYDLFSLQVDMGMTYDELSVFGRMRKIEKCGPYSTFTKLIHEWGSFLSPIQASGHSPMTEIAKC